MHPTLLLTPTSPYSASVWQDEETAQPKLFYSKVRRCTNVSPSCAEVDHERDRVASTRHRTAVCAAARPYARCVRLSLHSRPFLIAMPLFASATGGSAIKAVEVLMEHGVPEERIIFINLVSTVS